MKIFRSLSLIIAFYLIFTFPAEYVSADSEEERIDTAIELFKSGEYENAYNLLLKLFIDFPENLELNFYIGRAAFETGNYEMAVMAFERILIASPDEPRVKLEMARAFQRLGANDMARQYCNEVLAGNPPESVKANIKKFLIYIDKTEQKNFLTGMLSTGVDWNNNVWASPTSGKIKTIIGDISLTGPSAQKTQDWVYNTILVLNHTFRQPYTKDSWKTQAVVYNATYDETSELDLRLFGIMTGYQTEWSTDKRINLSFLANRVDLNDEKYLSTKGLKVSFENTLGLNLKLTSALKYEIKTYPDIPDKDADTTSASLDLISHHNKTWYNAGFKAETENAKEDEYDYDRFASTLSITRQLPFELAGSIRGSYQFTGYKGENVLFDEKRKDHQFIAGCTLKRKIWKFENQNNYMALNLNFQHTWTYSNIDLYDYRMGLVQLFLTYNF